jgi:hypothetical protein
MYNYDTDNIDTLDESQLYSVIDFVHYYLNYPTINTMIDNITSAYYSGPNINNIKTQNII